MRARPRAGRLTRDRSRPAGRQPSARRATNGPWSIVTPRRPKPPVPDSRPNPPDPPPAADADPATLSPMMVQYFEAKRAYPDCLLFFRMGD
ncbi:MAG: hypothetical protein GVY27_07185, partial [Deinococcus-Thermus bacterium]|nr:hypothetical protein [Deinococcota bacterium]